MIDEDRLLRLLQALYPAEAAARLHDGIAVLPKRQRSSVKRLPRNDCMLITYADSIVAEAETPLQTLRRFLRQNVGATLGRVHLLPFFPSSSDDGFAVIDYRMVDHHVGSWNDVEALSADYDLMFDLVINHCSRENLWFADFINARDPGRHFFITLPEESDTASVARPRSTPLISAVHTYGGIRHVWNTFSADQIDLNFENPEVLREFIEILLFYVARGARLVRLDAIGYLWKRLGTTCLNLPETHLLVKVLRAVVERAAPGVQLVTETNVPHDDNVSYFGDGDEAHMVYQFSLAPLLLYSFVFSDASYLTTWAARLGPPPPGTTYLNFIASHDGIGLRPLEGLMPDESVNRLVARMHERGGFVTLREVGVGSQKPYEINISLIAAFGGESGLAAYLAAHALLLSFQGSPALYIHSLLGTDNDLELVEQTGRTRSINRSRWTLHDLTHALQDPSSLHAKVLTALKSMLSCRNRQPALAPSATQNVLPAPPGAFAMYRTCDEQRILVIASVLDEPQHLGVSALDIPCGPYNELLSGESFVLQEQTVLAPYQVLWLEVP